ncbi:unnamed protein product [Periconia digitata]|uniref:NB-ARC domain-containing protein n=1 Tax=Periconia digitata TaxID=1303443 RepID=A0A9W4UB83_9PLEO|nr:unnamed protein product [Periconia digitata]
MASLHYQEHQGHYGEAGGGCLPAKNDEATTDTNSKPTTASQASSTTLAGEQCPPSRRPSSQISITQSRSLYTSLMDCCCFPFRFAPTRRRSISDSDSLSELEKDVEYPDLMNNEGSTLQTDLWRLTVRDKLADSYTSTEAFRDVLILNLDFDSCLASLSQQYLLEGFSKHVPRVRTVLESIKPFIAAITTMVQSSMIAGLVWGSMQLILANAVKLSDSFDSASKMLQDLAKLLPRFQAYTQVLHTPRLHAALREVYSTFIDFAFALVRFLLSHRCYTMVKIQWSTVTRQYNATKDQLAISCSDFEAEASLANVQVQGERHREVVERLSRSRSGDGGLESTVPAPRNVVFTGRDTILERIHEMLTLDSGETNAMGRSRQSVLIHNIGGMGKTEVALEYTYRYSRAYTHIFWLHAETATTLLSSFLKAVAKLDLLTETAASDLKVQVGLEWLRSTTKTWLLVFDNAIEWTAIRKFWPAGDRGSILVTSQNPALDRITSHAIELPPMNPEEGCTLLQRYLNRGRSEQKEGEALSTKLGGMPLAISHFAGYVANSQCSIKYITEVLCSRFESSAIWKSTTSISTSPYSHTLATVWDMAFVRLTSEARKLIRIMAFLDPDGVPEDIFIPVEPQSDGHSTWTPASFNESVRILRERHLINRDSLETHSVLRTHRALQQSILGRLDTDETLREETFEEAVSLIRAVLPEHDVRKRGDPSQWPKFRKYISQVVAMNQAFSESGTKQHGTLEFATVLRDAGSYLLNNGYQSDGIPILETGRTICINLIKEENAPASVTLEDITSFLQVYNHFLGIKGRKRSLALTTENLERRHQATTKIDHSSWSDLDHIRLSRALLDKGCASAQMNLTDAAEENMEAAISTGEAVGGEASIPSRYGMIYGCRMWVLGPRKAEDLIESSSKRALELLNSSVGETNPLTLLTRYNVGVAEFALGHTESALKAFQDVTNTRVKQLGEGHHDVLAGRYMMAVCYQNVGKLEDAENELRRTLDNNLQSVQWRNEDLARSQYRLGLVLASMNRPSEAQRMLEEARELQKTWYDDLPEKFKESDVGQDVAMEGFDFGVTLWHGRTTGIFSNGTYW